MELFIKNEDIDRKPAISAEIVIQALLKTAPQDALEKNYAPGEGFDWSPGEEEATLTRWLSGEELLYEGDPEKGSSD